MSSIRLAIAMPVAAVSVALGACSESTAANAACLGLETAPRSARVDLQTPRFSAPTAVTNPLFPVSSLGRVLLMGTSGGAEFRVETTLMPRTRTIRVAGRDVEALESQYVAWVDGRIYEVALDWYAQDDAGAVWYLGEDVFNFEDGVIVDTDGTWLAGREGPAAMIMAATPVVGNVWRPENACEIVFEEVKVVSTGVTVQGPRGPVSGAITVDELHMDGSHENKIFAPGYGEFSTGSGADLEAVALAVPTDAIAGAVPATLTTLSSGAIAIFDAVTVADWGTAATRRDAVVAAWTSLQATSLPPMIRARLGAAVTALSAAVTAQSAAAARQASIGVDLGSLDLQLRHRPIAAIDRALLDLWARQLLIHSAAGDQVGVLADVASLRWIRDRLVTDVEFVPELSALDVALGELQEAARMRQRPAIERAVARLLTTR